MGVWEVCLVCYTLSTVVSLGLAKFCQKRNGSQFPLLDFIAASISIGTLLLVFFGGNELIEDFTALAMKSRLSMHETRRGIFVSYLLIMSLVFGSLWGLFYVIKRCVQRTI